MALIDKRDSRHASALAFYWHISPYFIIPILANHRPLYDDLLNDEEKVTLLSGLSVSRQGLQYVVKLTDKKTTFWFSKRNKEYITNSSCLNFVRLH